MRVLQHRAGQELALLQAAPAALPSLKGRGDDSTHKTSPFVSPVVRLEDTCNPSGLIPYPRWGLILAMLGI